MTLRRRTPLRRKPMRRGRKRSAYARRERDTTYMLTVKRLACSVRVDPPTANPTPCIGRVEADHMGDRALSRKADDRTCAAMCWGHHRERTDHAGTFRSLTRAELREWRARQIDRTQREVGALTESTEK